MSLRGRFKPAANLPEADGGKSNRYTSTDTQALLLGELRYHRVSTWRQLEQTYHSALAA